MLRFRLLASEQGSDTSIPQLVPLSLPPAEQRRLVEDMLRVIDLDPSSYRLGLSQVRIFDLYSRFQKNILMILYAPVLSSSFCIQEYCFIFNLRICISLLYHLVIITFSLHNMRKNFTRSIFNFNKNIYVF